MVDWRNMLAHVLAAGAAGLAVSTGADFSATVLLSSGLSSFDLALSQAEDSSVGTESCWFSLLRVPLVLGWNERPRPAAPRAPLSEPRPRPRPPSETARPPRADREADVVDSLAGAVVVSFAFVRAVFFGFETSPHWEMLPMQGVYRVSLGAAPR